MDRPSHSTERLNPTRILAFWLPLAATWLMMAVEGPYVAAIIARLAEPTVNLAAYGVAFSFAFISEAPIIMIMTTANALVHDRDSFIRLRRFSYALNALVTVALIVALYPPLFRFVTDHLVGLPPDVAHLTHLSLAMLIPWPGAIGYRRFYQGILVRHGMPRLVAYGTIVRLATMSTAAVALAATTELPGACVGALALASGVVLEAVASRIMARHLVARLLGEPAVPSAQPLTNRRIVRFYYPLALTSLIAIGVNPLLTFFIGRSRSAVESLAVLPVILGLVFIFRSGAIAYQEVVVALSGQHREHEREVARVARRIAGVAAFALTAILFTPLSDVWFRNISGLPANLAALALWPARVLALVPALEYLLTFQRGRLVLAHKTRLITVATITEVLTIAAVVAIGVQALDLVGAMAATLALLAGRIAGNAFLLTVSPEPARATADPVAVTAAPPAVPIEADEA